MHTCHTCTLIITKSVCHYQKNVYHLECCKICFPQAPPKEPPAAKAKAGPGRLNFGQIGSFEKKEDFKCFTCKKKISGEKFLTHKVGEFDCKSCFEKRVEHCSKCNETFGTGEEIIVDDKGAKFCHKCFTEIQREKEREKEKEAPKNTIHCDKCTVHVESKDIVDYKEQKYHKACFACHSCKKHIDGKDAYADDHGNAHCIECYTKLFCKKCDKCSTGIGPNQKGITFEDKNLHEECFACLKCNHKIVADSDHIKADNVKYFKAENNQPCCLDCFGKHYCKGCAGCKHPILPSQHGLDFGEKHFHTEHFVCTKCSHKIKVDNNHPKADGTHFYADEKNQPFCLDCCHKCEGCGKGVLPTQAQISFEGKTYHKEHFQCSKCAHQLGDKDKVYKDDKEKPCCEPCYAKHFCKPCTKCSKGIMPGQTNLIFEGASYHKECFCCFNCSAKIVTEGDSVKADGHKCFKGEKDNKPYCVECYSKLFCKQCTKCSKGILPNQTGLSFNEKNFHRECFNCTNCSHNLAPTADGKTPKVYKNEKHEQFCIDCYTKLYCKKCEKCSNGISPEQTGVLYENKNFHLNCFQCIKCAKHLVNEADGGKIDTTKVISHNGEAHCMDCYRKHFCKPCDTCKKDVEPNQTLVSFENLSFHDQCFKCNCCSKHLESGGKNEIYKDDKNKPCCADCYANKFCKKCDKCKKGILPKPPGIGFEDKNYHKDCFCCSKCSHKLTADPGIHVKADNKHYFKGENNEPFCQDCFAKYLCKPCDGCKKGILPDEHGVLFENKLNFHKDCFKCDNCSIHLRADSDKVNSDGLKFFKNDKEKPCCIDCYVKLYCKKCDKCGKGISPLVTSTSVEDKKYHSDCLKCSKCHQRILPDMEKFTYDPKSKDLLCQKCSKPKEKTPPKGKAGPGRLNFGQIGNFENKGDVKCYTCKKIVKGQKFLTHKVGEFNCQACNAVNEASCFVCKKAFESREEFFKDEVNNNYCDKCFKIYQHEKKAHA